MSEAASETGNRSFKRIGIIAAVIAIAIAAFGIGSRMWSDRQLAEWTDDNATPVVAIIHATAVAGGEGLVLPGNVQAYNSAPIFARTNGYVSRWLVDIGDSVKTGQVLAILDAPEVDQQLAAARADLQTTRANEQLARTTAQRWQALVGRDAVSKQEADEKAGDLAAKSAIAGAATAEVQRLTALQGFTRLVAPFSGVITSRSTQIGALVTAGSASATPLFTVSDVNRMRIYVRVPQAYSGQIKPGLAATLTLPEYPGREFAAGITRTAGAVDPVSGTVLVELQAANGDRALKPGAYAQVHFPLHGVATSVTLPASALIIDADGTHVALLGRDGKARLRKITIGRDEGNLVEVTAGITARDRVIDSPPDALQDGDAVRTVKPAAPADARS